MINGKFNFTILVAIIVVFLEFSIPQISNAALFVFNFEADTIGQQTSFTDTNNGLSATFSSDSDPGGFEIDSTDLFYTLTGNVLFGSPDKEKLYLTIAFSSAITRISMNYALNTTELTDRIILHVPGIDNVYSTGTIPPGENYFFPEGIVSFEGTAFNTISINSEALNFAIDNITVESSAPIVPAPATLLLLGSGLLSLTGFRKKIKK